MSDKSNKFPTELKCWKYEIERIGRRLGYNFEPVIYEVVDSEHMSELAAFGGYPKRYHHWSFGQESLRNKNLMTRFGLATIFEMVIPTRPCYAYLLNTNQSVDQKSVMAHVVGHKDFFDNNFWFKLGIPDNVHTVFADDADTIDEFRAEFGREKVDGFIECCLSVDNLIDILDLSIRRLPEREKTDQGKKKEREEPIRLKTPDGLPAYVDKLLNPPEVIEDRRRAIGREEELESRIERGLIVPEAPVRDIMDFLYRYGSLEPWQREIVRIIRQESYMLYVGAQTKIMNEGWAAISEADIMVSELAGDASEVSEFAQRYAAVLRPGGINPYLLGRDLWVDIKRCFDTGRHGSIYADCREASILDRWDEFVVFKALADRHGIKGLLSSEGFKHDWSMFCTLIKETAEGRGATPVSLFSEEKFVTEWLVLDRVETMVSELERRLLKVSLAEKEIESKLKEALLPAEDLLRFKYRFEVRRANKFDPDLDWTEKEVLDRLGYLRKLLEFKQKFVAKELEVVSTVIPVSWLAWVSKYEHDRIVLGKGREKMFEVRKTYNDVSFIREFFTEDFCRRNGFFTVGVSDRFDPNTWRQGKVYVAKSTDFEKVRNAIISRFLNVGQPKIDLVDANYRNNRELLLVYRADDRGNLDVRDIPEVLFRLFHLWGQNKKVHIEVIETEYPPKPSWWDRWRPAGSPPSPKKKPKRRIFRYSYGDKANSCDKTAIDKKDAHPLTAEILDDLRAND